MSLQLVVDNTERGHYIDNLLRAVHVATSGEPIPQDMKDLILAIDEATIEDDLRLAVSLMPCKGPEKPDSNIRAV